MTEKDPNRNKEKGFAIPFLAHRFPKTPYQFPHSFDLSPYDQKSIKFGFLKQ
jgi:hypothetical protein